MVLAGEVEVQAQINVFWVKGISMTMLIAKGDLKCGENNCNPEFGFGSESDCCYDPEKGSYNN